MPCWRCLPGRSRRSEVRVVGCEARVLQQVWPFAECPESETQVAGEQIGTPTTMLHGGCAFSRGVRAAAARRARGGGGRGLLARRGRGRGGYKITSRNLYTHDLFITVSPFSGFCASHTYLSSPNSPHAPCDGPWPPQATCPDAHTGTPTPQDHSLLSGTGCLRRPLQQLNVDLAAG